MSGKDESAFGGETKGRLEVIRSGRVECLDAKEEAVLDSCGSEGWATVEWDTRAVG